MKRLGQLLILIGVAGCATTPRMASVCTEIGCSDGLTVEIVGNRTSHVTVEVAAVGHQTQTFECAATDAPCRTFYEGFTPQQVTVTVKMGDDTNQRTISPDYHDNQPNGPNCPPVCRQATVNMGV